MEENLPTIEEIDAIHDAIVENYDINYKGLNESTFSAERKLKDIIDEAGEKDDAYQAAAHLLRCIPIIHLYKDGNKRTAWLTAMKFLEREGIPKPDDQKEIEQVMKQIRRFDTEQIANWLKTGEIKGLR